MQFNITATASVGGLIQDSENLLAMEVGEISGSSDLMKRFTKDINTYYRRVNTWIWKATGTWEFDDGNFADFPIAYTNLVSTSGSEQQDYELPSTAQKIDRVEVLDDAGDYQLLHPIDKSEVGTAMSEHYDTPAMPTEYDMVGRSIWLYPAPGAGYVTDTKGLKIYFTRDVDQFAVSDTTKEPGFVSNFHRLLSLGAAYDYAFSYNMSLKANYIKGQINEMVKDLESFYSSRNRNKHIAIEPRKHNYK